MNSRLSILLSITGLATAALGQAQDIGLTMSAGPTAPISGQGCGVVGCTVFGGGNVGAGESRSLTHLGAPSTLYAIAIGFPGPCTPVPGFENELLLASPVVLGMGLTSAPPFVPTPCQQGLASESFTMPANVSPGITFRLQSLGQSSSGAFAFGPTIQAITS